MESLEQKYAQTLEASNLSLKQRRVLLSSLKLFSEIGFENTTSSLIAERAGVSEGTVFSYFKTKEGILEAILSTFLEQVIPEVIADFSEKKFTVDQETFPFFLKSIVEIGSFLFRRIKCMLKFSWGVLLLIKIFLSS